MSKRRSFEETWAKKETEGYQYGKEALEQVRFGWELGMDDAAQIIFNMTEFYQHNADALRALDDVRGAILQAFGQDPKKQGRAE